MRETLEQRLAPFGQQHLLTFWDELTPTERNALAAQIEQIDFAEIDKLRAQVAHRTDWLALARRAESPPAFRRGRGGERITVDAARAAGHDALARGELGVILVAGGQGTRLGWPHPKGTYPIGPVSGSSLFRILLEKLLALGRRYGVRVPLYLMTSPATHAETIAYLDEHQRFGLPAETLHIFCQAQMPAVDAASGRLLLEDIGRLALSPDGHGGMLSAVERSSGLADMGRRGLRHLFYMQVDNPLLRVADPEFVGYHLLSGSEMSTQVVAKREPRDKVGNVVSIDGRLQIIEYSDLPDEAAELREPDGSLKIWAGNTAAHLFELEFLERARQTASSLPFHAAHKKVPYVDTTGERRGQHIEPAEPNAIKFERFIFDLLPQAERAIVMEVDGPREFTPVKNGPGAATDSPETVRAAMIALHTEWLQSAGAVVAPGTAIEFSPLFALEPADLHGKFSVSQTIKGPTFFAASS
jgi:UDP-N-acetylglucosamine/UDP-N-acetylgalactosamine diphosphorylase